MAAKHWVMAVAGVCACKSPPSSVVLMPSAGPTAEAIEAAPPVEPCEAQTTVAGLERCIGATQHGADAAMQAAGLTLFWRDAVDMEAGFVALHRLGRPALFRRDAIGGGDAKGYAWSGVIKLVASEARHIAGHTIVVVRWEERMGGYSTGAGGVTDIRAITAAVCTVDGDSACPFVHEVERILTVTGGMNRRDREAWSFDIAPTGVLTARHTVRFPDDPGEGDPIRVELFR